MLNEADLVAERRAVGRAIGGKLRFVQLDEIFRLPADVDSAASIWWRASSDLWLLHDDEFRSRPLLERRSSRRGVAKIATGSAMTRAAFARAITRRVRRSVGLAGGLSVGCLTLRPSAWRRGNAPDPRSTGARQRCALMC